MPNRTQAAEILAAWREAEWRREAAAGADDQERWKAETQRLQAEYETAIEAAHRVHADEPPEWPADWLRAAIDIARSVIRGPGTAKQAITRPP